MSSKSLVRIGFMTAVVAGGCGDNIHLGQALVDVTPTSGLTTSEAGQQATFTVALRGKPLADVEIDLSSSNLAEGTVSPASLTFTSANFNAPQEVTITGVQDELADGTQPYTIVLAPAISKDKRYDGVDGDDVSVNNIDDDTAGITVTPTSGLTTTEAGGTAHFTVVLNSKPTADVSIGLSSNDTTEGTVSPASVTFTSDNWSAPQTVTVTGVNDFYADGTRTYKILTAPATSSDAGYSGLDADDVTVSNTDNDTAGVTVTPVSGLHTTETGGQATFTVVLSSRPTADVTIPVSSNDTTEGITDVASLTFTTSNWSAPQTVTITGQNDAVADGDQVYMIVTDPATSTDSGYSGFDAADVSVTNLDDDSPAVRLSRTSGLVTNEGGGQDTFTIVLASQPTADVTIALSSSDAGEGTVSPTSVTFTTTNWAAPQTVHAIGVDDSVADGDQPYQIITAPCSSADSGYNGLDPADVSATNVDNDSAGFTVTPTSGLVTSEGGGQATFTIVLTSQPTADVVVPLTSSNTAEGTVSPTSLTFTPTNWAAPQTVTVTGVDDLVADGGQLYTIFTGPATSADTGYNGKDPLDVTVTNTDNDSAGITVSPVTGLTTSEGGGQATFTIVLQSQPTADVTIGLSSSDTSEGTVSPSSVTFTAANWNAPQTVTVTGVNDFIADGNIQYSIVTAAATSSDTTYAGINAADVTVTNVDNDSAGIIVTPTAGLDTTEGGGTATFTIVLQSQPTASVTIGLSSNNTAEGTASPSSVTFTTLNWSAPQTITVTGVDDSVADGNQIYKIITAAATSGDANYNNLDADDVTVRNLDNDTPGILVSPTSGLSTSEGGGTATFAVVLQSQPTQDVTIPLSSNDPTEGSVSPASLTFTATNWNAPQVVTVTGLDDAIADGNQPYKILTGAASSSDPLYNGLDAPDVSLTNIDNDSPGIRVTPTSGLTTTEGGGTATFDVVLESQPTSDVTIAISSSDTTEGNVLQSSLTFTPANWNAAQTVTIVGVNDAIADGNQPYTITLAPAVSFDAGYSGLDAPDVSVTNIDNDSAGVIVTPTSGLVTTEAGGSDYFTVVLTSQPTANVTITLSVSDATEGTLPVTTLTFTPADWNLAQTVTVTGVNDSITDGNQVYTVITSAASSSDPAYNNLPVPDVLVTNTDDDIPGFTVDPTSGLITSEFGDFDQFTIVLNTAPTADVVIGLSSSDTTEATVSPASVTFTAANWNIPQPVTVTGVNDNLADGTQPFTILTAPASSADPNYNLLNPPDVTGSNFDNDTPGVYIKARRLLRTSESGQSTFFRVSLTTQPVANVTCTFSSSDTTEGTISPTTLTFTPANYATLQTITVSGVDDTILDGDQLYTIISAPCSSSDGNYNGYDPRDVSVVNRDNE